VFNRGGWTFNRGGGWAQTKPANTTNRQPNFQASSEEGVGRRWPFGKPSNNLANTDSDSASSEVKPVSGGESGKSESGEEDGDKEDSAVADKEEDSQKDEDSSSTDKEHTESSESGKSENSEQVEQTKDSEPTTEEQKNSATHTAEAPQPAGATGATTPTSTPAWDYNNHHVGDADVDLANAPERPDIGDYNEHFSEKWNSTEMAKKMLGLDASAKGPYKRAYNKTALKWHPDRMAGNNIPAQYAGYVTETFQKIGEAFKYLEDNA
jgi:hypothetical protein